MLSTIQIRRSIIDTYVINKNDVSEETWNMLTKTINSDDFDMELVEDLFNPIKVDGGIDIELFDEDGNEIAD